MRGSTVERVNPVIVLNGGSSSGKTSIARSLQRLLGAPQVAETRERSRPDRVRGMARLQAARVHEGIVYDLIVDTTATSAAGCARTVAAHLRARDD